MEKKLSAMDKDFMILWSNYLISGEKDMQKLTELAENGQIEAMQKYYLYDGAPNAKIEARIENFGEQLTPDEYLVKVYRYYSKNKERIDSERAGLKFRRDNAELEMNAYIDNTLPKFTAFNVGLIRKEFIRVQNELGELEESVYQAEYDVKNYAYNKMLLDAADRFYKLGDDTNDPFLIERGTAIQGQVLADKELWAREKRIKKAFMKLKKANPDSEKIQYELAKFLIEHDGDASEKELQVALRILLNLASQPYSDSDANKKETDEYYDIYKNLF